LPKAEKLFMELLKKPKRNRNEFYDHEKRNYF